MMEPGKNWLIVTEVCVAVSVVALLVSAAATAHYAWRITRTVRSFRSRTRLLVRRGAEAAASVRQRTRAAVNPTGRTAEVAKTLVQRMATSFRGIRCRHPNENRSETRPRCAH